MEYLRQFSEFKEQVKPKGKWEKVFAKSPREAIFVNFPYGKNDIGKRITCHIGVKLAKGKRFPMFIHSFDLEIGNQ